jgi:hypothetical protein
METKPSMASWYWKLHGLFILQRTKKNENSFTTGCTSYKHPHHIPSSKSPRNLISTIHFWSLGACKISLFWGKCFWNFLSSVLNYSFWMANFAARKWPECRILHHLYQGSRTPAVGHLASGVAGVHAWWAPNKLCGLPKLTWPLKYFLSFKHWFIWRLQFQKLPEVLNGPKPRLYTHIY